MTANRGKEAEAKVKKLLEKLSHNQDLVYYRLPDARSGSLQATLADFLVLWKKMPIILEVKEVAHDYRLSYNNFSIGQVGRQRLWQVAGASSLVLVHHSTSQLWRCLPISYFGDRSCGGSWDLRAFTQGTLEEIYLCQLNAEYLRWVKSLQNGPL